MDRLAIILGILTGVVGFYVSSVVTSIREQPAIVFNLERDDSRVTLSLANVSRDQVIRNAVISLHCRRRDGKTPNACFTTAKDTVPTPLWVDLAPSRTINKRVIEQQLSMLPGSEIILEAPVPSNKELEFHFLFAQEDRHTIVLINEAQSFGGGAFLRNFHPAMSFAFIVSIGLVLGLCAALLLGRAAGDVSENKKQIHRNRASLIARRLASQIKR